MSVTSTWGAAASAPAMQLVVVTGDSDDLEIGLDVEQGAHALPHDHVVVGEEDRDPTGVLEAGIHPPH